MFPCIFLSNHRLSAKCWAAAVWDDTGKSNERVEKLAPNFSCLKVPKMKFSKLGLVAFVATLAAVPCAALAADPASQNFKVVVPDSISITAPAAVSITHDQTDNPQAFPAQSWAVKGNLKGGVTVSFATASPFVHSTDSSFKRNAKLNLALNNKQGPATWTVDVNQDQTDYVGNDPVAQVTANSNGVGRANFDLTVTFVTEDFSLFAAGDYITTVTGTISAK